MRTASGCRPEGPRRAGERGGGERARGARASRPCSCHRRMAAPGGASLLAGSPHAGENRGTKPRGNRGRRAASACRERGGAGAPFSLLSQLLSHPPPPPPFFSPFFFFCLFFFLFLEGAAARAHKQHRPPGVVVLNPLSPTKRMGTPNYNSQTALRDEPRFSPHRPPLGRSEAPRRPALSGLDCQWRRAGGGSENMAAPGACAAARMGEGSGVRPRT